jgi:hypothetical protein
MVILDEAEDRGAERLAASGGVVLVVGGGAAVLWRRRARRRPPTDSAEVGEAPADGEASAAADQAPAERDDEATA